MTIEEVGNKVQQRDARFKGLSAKEAGEQYLAAHPVGWEKIDDGVVAQHLLNYKERSVDVGGIGAFFGKLGERQRSEYFEQRRQTAAAIVGLEELQDKLFNSNLQKQLGIASAKVTIAAARKAIYQMGIDAALALEAANHGMTLQAYSDLRADQERATLLRDAKKQDFEHEVRVKTLDSGLRVSESQSTYLLTRDLEKLRSELALLLKDKEHQHAQEIESLRFDLRKKETELDHTLKQEEINKEVEGTIRLANTENLTRAQSLAMLEDYVKKHEESVSPRMKENYLREIERLEKELYGESSTVAAKKDAGEEPGGGNAPPIPGSEPQSPSGTGGKSNSIKGDGFELKRGPDIIQ